MTPTRTAPLLCKPWVPVVTGSLLIFCIFPLQAVTIPSSTHTVNLQQLSSTSSSFALPPQSTINTTSGDGISGNASRDWLLSLQGPITAAGNGVSLSSKISSQAFIDNYGAITARGISETSAGVVLLNGGSLTNHSGATINSSANGIYSAVAPTTVINQTSALISGNIGVHLAASNSTLNNSGTITGTGGTAVLLSGSNNNLVLDSGSAINGDLISTGTGNTLFLLNNGVLDGNIQGTSSGSGFRNLMMNGIRWDLNGNINLIGTSPASLFIAGGGLLVVSGTLTNSSQGAGVTVAQKGSLQIGDGGTTGELDVPISNDGTVTFYRSDSKLVLNTPISGDGVLVLRGTGVSNQSSYILQSDANTFNGNVVIGAGARLQTTSANPAPRAHIVVSDGGTLWLGSSAIFTSPILVKGNGWTEPYGQLGALRLDSGATAAGPVTLLGNTRITAVFSNYTGTISGDIDDASHGYQLEKSGDGLITLSGDNTYSGGTLLSDGTLSVSQDNNLGANSSTLIFNGGTLLTTGDFISNRVLSVNSPGGTLSLSGTNTFAGGISGAGNLTLSSGILTLAGDDSRTGSTQINAGTQLNIGSAAVNNASQGTLGGNVLNNGTLAFNRTGTSAYSGVLTGNGALVKQNSGRVSLTGIGSSQPNINVNGGTLAFDQNGVFNTQAVTTASGAQTSIGPLSSLLVAGQMIQQADASLELSLDLLHPAATATQISLAGALSLSGAPGSASSISRKNLNILHSTTPGGIMGDFGELGFSNPADYLIVSGTKVNNDSDYNLTFGLRWFGGPAQGNGSFTLNNAPDTFNVDVNLADQTGPFTSGWDGKTLTQDGAGTLQLSTQNTYSGSTLINGGTLQTNVDNAFASSSSVTINSGATLNLNGFSQLANNLGGAGNIALGSGTLDIDNTLDTAVSGAISGSGKIVKDGAQSLTLSGINTLSGGMQINSGAIVATSGNALGSGAIVNNSLLNLNFATISPVVNLLSGIGVIEKNGAGIAKLTHVGSSAGSVNVNSGAFNIGANVGFTTIGDFTTAAGAATGIAAQGSVNTGGLFDMKGAFALVVGNVEPVVRASTVLLDTLSSLNITGISTPDETPQAQLADSTYRVINASIPGALDGDFSELRLGGATLPVDYATITGHKDLLNQNYDVNIRLNWYASHSSTPDVANGVFTLANPDEQFELGSLLADQIANPDTGWDGKTLTKAGLGTLILSRHNVYDGATLVNGGTLQTGIANALSQSSSVQLATGTLLSLDDFNQSINNLSGGGGVDLGSATLSLNNTTDTFFSGVIDGDGSVNKNGNSTLILSADNLYTGVTTINGGVLQLGSGGAGGSVNGDILNNATLVFDNNQDKRFLHTISGTGEVIKNGNNALQFTTNQTYTGTTQINSGTLILGNGATPVNLATSQLNIAENATFGGYGNIAGNINNQGVLAVADALPLFSQSAVGNMTVGGNVINSGNIIMASPLPASTLTINGDYFGNGGTLTLSTVLGDDHSATDKLVILGNSRGDTRVHINNAGGSGAATINGIEIISVAGESAGSFTLDGRAVAGAYDYFLQKGLPDAANGNWYLRNQLPSPPTPPIPPTPVPTPENAVVRPEAGSYIANLAAASSLFNQRLEDRAGRAENSSLWLRQTGSRNGFYDGSGQLDTSTNRYVIQGGGELAKGQFGSDDSLGLGLMFGYGNAHNNTYANRSGYSAKGQVDGYSSGVYATWYQNSRTQEGAYADSWLQYSWLNARVNGDQLPGENYDINGMSGSVESGYRIPVYAGNTASFYLTPQAQLIWDGLQADDHTESNGTRITSEGNNNLQSRVGIKLSRDGVAAQDAGTGKLFTTYIETNWIYNSQQTAVSLDDEPVQQAGTRNLGEIKLGVEGKLNHHLNVWSNVGQQIGGSGYSDVSAVIGLNYQF